MSKYSQSGFRTYYGSTTGPYRNDIAGNITGLTHQQLATDLADSVVFQDSFYDTDINYFQSEEWLGNGWGASTSTYQGWTTFFSGAGSSVAQGSYGADTTNHAIGIVAVAAGTSAAGVASVYSGLIGVGSFFIRHRQRIGLTRISSGSERFTVRCGFGDIVAAGGEHTNGIFFRYVDNVNSGKWQAVTRSAGTETATDTGVTPTTSYAIYEIQVNAAGTSVTFYINGTLVATNTTNIPTAIGVGLYMNTRVDNSITTLGGVASQDWYDLLLTRTAAR